MEEIVPSSRVLLGRVEGGGGQNLPDNTISKIFQLDSTRSNLFSKLDSFWKSILVNSTSRRIQPFIQQVNKFDLYCTWKSSSTY